MIARRKYNATGSAWLSALSWPESRDALAALPVVVPVGGACLDHGPHLPCSTDRDLAWALVEGLAAVEPVLVAPIIDYVYSPEHLGRPGSIALQAETFIALVSDVLRSLARTGARHIVLVPHGTALLAPLQVTARMMLAECGIPISIASERGLGWLAYARHAIRPDELHAGPTEIALMSALFPSKVREIDGELFATAQPPPDLRVIHRRAPTSETSTPATAHVGHDLFSASVADLATHIRNVKSGWPQPETAWSPDPTPAERELIWPEPSQTVGVRGAERYGDDPLTPGVAAAVLPMGASSKEHGLHMPNQVDYLTAQAQGDAAVAHAPIWLLPTLGYGYYPAFVDFPGSMSISPPTYLALVRDIGAAVAATGMEKFVLMDTGISTRPVLEMAVEQIAAATGMEVALTTTEFGAEVADQIFAGEGTHANEDETAMMLALAPEQVFLELAYRDMRDDAPVSTSAGPPAIIQASQMSSSSGVFGDPTKATTENGRRYLAAKLADVRAFLDAFLG